MDSQGRSSYSFCDSHSKGITQRVATDTSCKSLASIFTLIQATCTNAGNWGKALAWFTGTVTASMAGAVFPADSKLQSQSDTTTATAFAYDVRPVIS